MAEQEQAKAADTAADEQLRKNVDVADDQLEDVYGGFSGSSVTGSSDFFKRASKKAVK